MSMNPPYPITSTTPIIPLSSSSTAWQMIDEFADDGRERHAFVMCRTAAVPIRAAASDRTEE
jgi:hypothetical protein